MRRWPAASRWAVAARAPPAWSDEHDVGVDEARRAVDEDERDAGVAVAREVAVVGARRGR